MTQNELCHYGILGMKWGVRRYQPYPSGSTRRGKEIGEAANAKRRSSLERHYNKAVRKFEKIDAKREKVQDKANAKFEKAEKKSHSHFSSEKSTNRAFEKARDLQYKSNRLARKGEKWYNAMLDSFGQIKFDSFDQKTRDMGQRYIDLVANNSMMMFNQAFIYERGLQHSAKGSVWEKHRYVKVVGGKYYYPDDYDGGRHISSLKDSEVGKKDNSPLGKKQREVLRKRASGSSSMNRSSDTSSIGKKQREEELSKKSTGTEPRTNQTNETLRKSGEFTKEEIEQLAYDVIRGDYGNGQERKDKLGDNYQAIQDKVNEIYKTGDLTRKVSETSQETIQKGQDKIEEVLEVTSKKSDGIDLDEVYSVYNKKNKKG